MAAQPKEHKTETRIERQVTCERKHTSMCEDVTRTKYIHGRERQREKKKR